MKKQIELGPVPVVCQKWEESELGWGLRPDGFSLHLTFDGLKGYIKSYWASMPDEAPETYSRPSGKPYPVGVASSVERLLVENGGSLRYGEEYQYPGSGGIDGWMPEGKKQ